MDSKKIKEIMALDNDPDLEGLNPVARIDAIAGKVDLTDKERMEMKQTAVSGLNAWKEARDGIICKHCHAKAKWMGVKGACVDKEGLGWDVFPFKCCSCGKITEQPWRAPSLDGKEIEPYVTKYKKGESGIVIEGLLKLEDFEKKRGKEG